MDEISLINRGSDDLTILIEPEGSSVLLRPGQDCVVQAARSEGDNRDLRFELTHKPGVVGIYLMCDKVVLIDGKKVL